MSFPRKPERSYQINWLTVKSNSNNVGHNRFGVIIGSGAVKGAVLRHRLKRRILARAATAPNRSTDFLFIVNKNNALLQKTDKDINKTLDIVFQ